MGISKAFKATEHIQSRKFIQQVAMPVLTIGLKLEKVGCCKLNGSIFQISLSIVAYTVIVIAVGMKTDELLLISILVNGVLKNSKGMWSLGMIHYENHTSLPVVIVFCTLQKPSDTKIKLLKL